MDLGGDMAKKFRMMRTFARTAAKSLEKRLVENAKRLRDEPYLIIPDYDDNYSRKIFEKIKKSLDKVCRFKDDTSKLEKLANKRSLDGALAGTLLIAHSEKAPYLAVARFSTGDISYAQRGRADKEKLIAVQYFDNPVFRLLGIKDIALKKGIHVYSWDEGFISTGLELEPPKEFVSFITKKTGLKQNGDVLICGDIRPEDIKNKKVLKKNYLRIHWKSANIFFGICEDCVKEKQNTIFNITKYMIEPDISSDFSIEVVGQIIKQKDQESAETKHLDDYLSGKLKDIDFIKKNIQLREESLKDSDQKILILDGVSYGIDSDKFIEALKSNKYEKEGLKYILENVDEPVIFDNTSPNKVLEHFWKDYGIDTIKSIINDENMAKKFFSLDETPSDILKLVFQYRERQKILANLPSYKSLPPLSNFIDNVVKTYKTFGEKEALIEIKKRPDNPKGKSVAYAFLLVLGKGKDKKWQYSQVEIEYGEFLKDYTKKLLDSDPNKYHDAFKELLVASGSSEEIDAKKI